MLESRSPAANNYTGPATGNAAGGDPVPDGDIKRLGGEVKKILRPRNGEINTDQAIVLLNRIIAQINADEGTRIPSIKRVENNMGHQPVPIDSTKWDWNHWDKNLYSDPVNGPGMMVKRAIYIILGGNIGKDEDRVLSLHNHEYYKKHLIEIERGPLDESFIRNIISGAKTGADILQDLCRGIEVTPGFRLTPMIRSAIELGYLPEKDIQKIYSKKDNPPLSIFA